MKYFKKLEKVLCNLCKGNDSCLWGEKDGFRIVKCKNCNLVYINPRLNPKNLKIIYGKTYFNRHTQVKLLNMRLKMYRIEIAEIEKLKSGGKILDVGCGEGYMLSLFGKNWKKFGTEINRTSAKFAKDKFGIRVKIGNLKNANFTANQFDAISIRGVIEHIPDPLAEMKEIARILKPNGIVAVNTPNIECLAAKIFKENYRLIDPKVHLYYFSPDTLSQMIKKAGLKVKQIKYFYLDTPYASPIKDITQMTSALIKRVLKRNIDSLSPPFFDNVIHLYASKPLTHK